jgi:pimeloyl-ACP methyl ester carboxylesterase
MLLLAACQRQPSLPPDFTLHEETCGGIGGGRSRSERWSLTHYPIIFVSDNRCDPLDWLGIGARGSACGACDAIGRFRAAGFAPIELWLLRVVPPGRPMQSLEAHTDDLRQFVFSVLRYTGAPKVQIVGHGAGAPLAHWTLKKYNLYNLVHAMVYLGGPMRGLEPCDWRQCVETAPLCCSLTPGSTLLREMMLPSPTPYSALDNRGDKWASVKYLTLYNGRSGGDALFITDPESPTLPGAVNRAMPDLDHEGLRCSDAAANVMIPFLSDRAATCRPENDKDGDGFCDVAAGGADCNDRDPTIYPGAPEVCEDGVDQDCNGFDFACHGGRDIPLKPAIVPKK